MKKDSVFLLLVIAVFAILSVSVLAASVSRNMPSRVSPGEDVAVAFSISGVNAGELFTLEDKLPAGWQFVSWDVAGAKGGKDKVDHRSVAADNRHGFSYVSEGSSSQITFNVKVPASASLGSYNFDAVYFDSSGQGRSQGSVTVRNIACGDGVCEGSENTQTCVADCPAPAQPSPVPAQPSEPVPPAKKPTSKGILYVVIAVVAVAVIAWWLLKKRKK